MTKKNFQCLMIVTPDKRRMFTQQKNFRQLVEFANTFNAEISVVKIEEGEVLDLEALAMAISDPVYTQNCSFEQLEARIVPESKKTFMRKPKKSNEITDYVKDLFLNGHLVSLREVLSHFADRDISSSYICSHISRVRKELEGLGYRIIKVGGGKYRMAN